METLLLLRFIFGKDSILASSVFDLQPPPLCPPPPTYLSLSFSPPYFTALPPCISVSWQKAVLFCHTSVSGTGG